MKIRNVWPRLVAALDTLVVVLATGCALTTMAAAQQAPSTRLTFQVCCPDNQVDARHRVTVVITKPDNTKVTVTVEIPAQNGSEGIALRVANALEAKGVPATKAETTKKNADKALNEDVVIPEGHKVDSVKVEKKPGKDWENDDGHLKVYNGKTKLSGQRIGSGGNGASITTLVLAIRQSTAVPLRLGLDIYGVDAAGSNVAIEYTQTTSSGSVPAAMQSLASYLTSLGFTTSFGSTGELHVNLHDGWRSFDSVYFAVDETPPVVGDRVDDGYLVEWEFAAD